MKPASEGTSIPPLSAMGATCVVATMEAAIKTGRGRLRQVSKAALGRSRDRPLPYLQATIPGIIPLKTQSFLLAWHLVMASLIAKVTSLARHCLYTF